jgi:hypothetical protein
MTREMKLGLAMAGSFVALAAVVIVSRLKPSREPTHPPKAPAPQVVKTPEKSGQGKGRPRAPDQTAAPSAPGAGGGRFTPDNRNGVTPAGLVEDPNPLLRRLPEGPPPQPEKRPQGLGNSGSQVKPGPSGVPSSDPMVAALPPGLPPGSDQPVPGPLPTPPGPGPAPEPIRMDTSSQRGPVSGMPGPAVPPGPSDPKPLPTPPGGGLNPVDNKAGAPPAKGPAADPGFPLPGDPKGPPIPPVLPPENKTGQGPVGGAPAPLPLPTPSGTSTVPPGSFPTPPGADPGVKPIVMGGRPPVSPPVSALGLGPKSEPGGDLKSPDNKAPTQPGQRDPVPTPPGLPGEIKGAASPTTRLPKTGAETNSPGLPAGLPDLPNPPAGVPLPPSSNSTGANPLPSPPGGGLTGGQGPPSPGPGPTNPGTRPEDPAPKGLVLDAVPPPAAPDAGKGPLSGKGPVSPPDTPNVAVDPRGGASLLEKDTVKPAVAQEQGVGIGVPTPKGDAAGGRTSGVPPLGGKANVATPPVKVLDPQPAVRPADPAQHRTEVFDVQYYRCNAEDASFEALSRHFYQSPDYAAALQQFNRDYSGQTDAGLQDPKKLRPGTLILAPALPQLLKRHPELIPNRKQAPPPARESIPISRSGPVDPVERGPASVGGSPPPAAEVVPSLRGPAPVQAVPVSANGPPPATKEYRVGPGPQHLYVIAQQTLGNADRWTDLYRLNPSLNPNFPIPEGTTLVLPGDARTP